MHIALFVQSFKGSGGAERVFLNMACGLLEKGHRVDLVMGEYKGHYLDCIPSEIRVVDLRADSAKISLLMIPKLGWDAWFWIRLVLKKKAGYALNALPGLANYLQEEKPDAVISSMHYPNLVAVLARDLAKVQMPIILTIHNTLSQEIAHSKTKKGWFKMSKIKVDQRIFPRADAVVAVSQGVADDLAETLAMPKEVFSVIYNPVDIESVQLQAVKPLSHPWFDGGDIPVLLAVGGFKGAKDHATLLKAFSVVRKERAVRLIILGEGSLRESLTELAEELGVNSDLEMPGFVDNPFQYMQRASMLVLSSIFEGFAMVIVEALACGCPVVSTDCPCGPREILDNGRYGALVPVGDVEGLAASILRTLETPQDKSVLRARSTDFSLHRATEKYIELIETVKK